MKVVFINTSDRIGGAGIACSRLQKALEKHQCIESVILTQEKRTDNPAIISIAATRWKKRSAWIRFVAERLLFLPFEKSKAIRFLFNRGMVGIDITSDPHVRDADIIHLHWINFGFLSIGSLKKIFALGKPVVWTLHDMWAFTGGCHHSGACSNYQRSCGNCAFLRNPSDNDISHNAWLSKCKSYAPFTAISCSQWLMHCAKNSSLLARYHHESIPNPIDTDAFCPILKCHAREQLGLPGDKLLVLFAAMRINATKKGFSIFEKALHILRSRNLAIADHIEVVILGAGNSEALGGLPFRIHLLGQLCNETEISLAYNAASVYVTPSLEENLPNTIMEAFACGTPVVGFHIGGIPEMIEHQNNGYLSDYASPESLADGIDWVLKNNADGRLSERARQKVLEEYSEKVVAAQYSRLYDKLLHCKQG